MRTRFAGGGELSLTLSLWRPPGDGPFPVVLDGDGCWRYFDDQVVRQVVARGNIAASFDRTEAAADNKDAYRQTGLYRLLPDATFGVLSAWAWAFHRCVDALVGMADVRADGIAVTGHSRGGKAALLAGVTDERIAVTNPNNSGIGGAGLNRLKVKHSEVIDDFYGSGNIFWFGQGFKDHRHRDAELPYDQHYLLALVAPRLLLLTEAYEDHAANPAGTYVAAQAARERTSCSESRRAPAGPCASPATRTRPRTTRRCWISWTCTCTAARCAASSSGRCFLTWTSCCQRHDDAVPVRRPVTSRAARGCLSNMTGSPYEQPPRGNDDGVGRDRSRPGRLGAVGAGRRCDQRRGDSDPPDMGVHGHQLALHRRRQPQRRRGR